MVCDRRGVSVQMSSCLRWSAFGVKVGFTANIRLLFSAIGETCYKGGRFEEASGLLSHFFRTHEFLCYKERPKSLHKAGLR